MSAALAWNLQHETHHHGRDTMLPEDPANVQPSNSAFGSTGRPLGPDGVPLERRQQRRRRESAGFNSFAPDLERRLSPGRRLEDWVRR